MPGCFNFSLIYPYRTYPIERKQCSRKEFVFSFSLTYLRIRCYCSFVFDFLSSSSRSPFVLPPFVLLQKVSFPAGFQKYLSLLLHNPFRFTWMGPSCLLLLEVFPKRTYFDSLRDSIDNSVTDERFDAREISMLVCIYLIDFWWYNLDICWKISKITVQKFYLCGDQQYHCGWNTSILEVSK